MRSASSMREAIGRLLVSSILSSFKYLLNVLASSLMRRIWKSSSNLDIGNDVGAETAVPIL